MGHSGLLSTLSPPFPYLMLKISGGKDWLIGWSLSKGGLECQDKLFELNTVKIMEVKPRTRYIWQLCP